MNMLQAEKNIMYFNNNKTDNAAQRVLHLSAKMKTIMISVK